jgi:hypothetical protein
MDQADKYGLPRKLSHLQHFLLLLFNLQITNFNWCRYFLDVGKIDADLLGPSF